MNDTDKNDNNDSIEDDKTTIVDGIGKATCVGELDVEKFIDIAMSLPSFWKGIK